MLQAYLNNPALKDAFLTQIAAHEAADAVTQGLYGDMEEGRFKGCAVGCSLRSLNILQGKADVMDKLRLHQRYEAELGLPTWLAYIEDHVFEMLPVELARTWPRRFSEAIPVGVEVTDRLLARLLWWTLADPTYGVRRATDDAAVRGWIDTIVACLDAEARGEATTDQRKVAARAARAAWDARAARGAWDASAARAARAAWDASAARGAWAAWDAWDARAARAARAAKIRDGFYPAFSEFILSELRALGVEGR